MLPTVPDVPDEPPDYVALAEERIERDVRIADEREDEQWETEQ